MKYHFIHLGNNIKLVIALNVVPKLYTVPNGKPRMYFKALKDIEKGEELCYQYGDTDKRMND